MKYTLTEGSIARSMVGFAFPMLIGNLFQQLYSMVDAIIVGQLLGQNALAAVSLCVAPNYLMTDLITGLTIGAGIVIANAYGAKDEERLFKAVHTTVMLSIIMGIIVTVLAWVCARPFLTWLNAPQEVLGDAARYFQFYYVGAIGMALYNCGTSILRSVGDSVRPLIYLIITSVINVVLDYVFVAWMGFGVGSVAVATSIAQSISAVLCMYRLMRYKTPYQLFLSRVRLYSGLIMPIVRYSIPTGIQNGMIGISNVLISASINIFGAAVIAGSGIWFRIQGFALMPVMAMVMAISTYVAQNDGARKYDRIIRGSRIGIYICVGIGIVATLLLVPFAEVFSKVFSNEPLVIENAILNAKIMGPLLVLLAFTHAIGGVLQGAGLVKKSMWTYILTWCIARTVICMLVVKVYPMIELVYLAYPITWIMSSVTFAIFYRQLMASYRARTGEEELTAECVV